MWDVKKIFPVVVLYKCQLVDSTVYKTVIEKNAFSEFLIYDNSPELYTFDESFLPNNAIYIRDVNNGGVSKAYNVAADYALAHNYSHILLLDQDTDFPEGAIDVYRKKMDAESITVPLLQMKNGNPFSPCLRTGLRTKAVNLPPGVYLLKDYSPVNSGICVPLSIFSKVGGYNEKVKLDFADYEFISRCKTVCEKLTILPIVAIQDFSNEETDVNKLLSRYSLYLESATATQWSTCKEKLMMHVEVLLHTLALTRRTLSLKFLIRYFHNIV